MSSVDSSLRTHRLGEEDCAENQEFMLHPLKRRFEENRFKKMKKFTVRPE
jgi:hypothetical protein